jgi:hypothetical protein
MCVQGVNSMILSQRFEAVVGVCSVQLIVLQFVQ